MALGIPAIAWVENSALIFVLIAGVLLGIAIVLWWHIHEWRGHKAGIPSSAGFNEPSQAIGGKPVYVAQLQHPARMLRASLLSLQRCGYFVIAMKKLFLVAVASAALAIPAWGADLPAPVSAPVYKAPAFASAYDWTGVYFGGFGSYSWTTANSTTTNLATGVAFAPVTNTASAWHGGGQIGYDYMLPARHRHRCRVRPFLRSNSLHHDHRRVWHKHAARPYHCKRNNPRPPRLRFQSPPGLWNRRMGLGGPDDAADPGSGNCPRRRCRELRKP